MSKESEFIDWLINTVAYPFDYQFNPPPPVNPEKLALRWKELDEWSTITDAEAIDLVREEMGLE